MSSCECHLWTLCHGIPYGLEPRGRTRKPGPKGPLSCLMLVPGPAPVSQAPREAPARRAPSSVYLEEKSDQQKKEEVGRERAGCRGGGVLAAHGAAFQLSSPAPSGPGAGVTHLLVGQFDGEVFQNSETDRRSGVGLRKPGKGRERPYLGLARPNPTRPKCTWDLCMQRPPLDRKAHV